MKQLNLKISEATIVNVTDFPGDDRMDAGIMFTLERKNGSSVSFILKDENLEDEYKMRQLYALLDTYEKKSFVGKTLTTISDNNGISYVGKNNTFISLHGECCIYSFN